MKNLRLISLAVSICFLTNTSLVYGATVQDLINQQKRIEQSQKNMQNQISQIKGKKEDVANDLESINNKLSQILSTLSDVNARLSENQSKINSLNKQINEIKKKADKQRGIMETRLKVYYENGDVTYLDVLLNSDNFADFMSRMDAVKQLVNFDKSIIDEMESLKKDLDVKMTELNTAKEEIMKDKNQLEVLKREQVDAKAKKDAVMAKLTEEQRKIERQYEQEEQDSLRIQAEIKRLTKGSSKDPYSGGSMSWPAPGHYTVTSPYGYRVHPILKVKKMHTGIDISAPTGATIVAANDGKVIVAGWVSGYGNTVVIDHGGGITSLYGHNSSLNVSVGQKVQKGNTIAKAGSTGNSTGPHCHFEVRKNGSPANPMSYLK